MGRLQLLSICTVLLFGSVAFAGLSTNKKELERAAELAVERAAEKAAERAVEKALNSGNSSTITVTVKESYSNAKKTAEEAAAPGSESTRPYDPKLYDRQYGYTPPGDYKVDASAEAEELGISKESLNSSVEDIGEEDVKDADKSVESAVDVADLSFENIKGVSEGDKTTLPIITDSIKADIDSPASTAGTADFEPDFTELDISAGDASFGLKSNTKTFTSSYSKSKDFPGGKTVEVDDEEDAEVFKMYADDFGENGWSSSKQEGWVRHRPLWDDNKTRVSADVWEDFSGDDVSTGETKTKDKKVPAEAEKPKAKVQKRMAEFNKKEQIVVPLATLSLDPKTPSALYRLLQKEAKLAFNGKEKIPVPMKVYITIPVPYLPSYGLQKDVEAKATEPKPRDISLTAKQLNDEMNEDGSLVGKDPFKRSSNDNKDDFFASFDAKDFDFDQKTEAPKDREHRSILDESFDKLEAVISDLKDAEKPK